MKIIWLKTELLHPVDKGGKIRTYQMLRELKKDHHVTYLTLDDGSAAPNALDLAAEYANEVITIPHETTAKFSARFYLELARNTVSSLPYALERYVSAAMTRKLRLLVASGEFDLVICDFLAPAVNVPADLDIPTVLFQHNVEAMIWRRHYEVARRSAKKIYFRSQWHKMAEYERRACARFDRVVAVSKADADTIRADYGVDHVTDIPTGVDTEYFSPTQTTRQRGIEIVFTGSMDWLPNEDAIEWFTAEILPRIRAKVPSVSLTVVGRGPSPSLTALSDNDPLITVTGRVHDVRPYMARAGAYIVPIRIGGGTRLKIYEAMAMGLPVVSTAVGAEGLSVTDGRDILLRDEPDAFAEAVSELLLNAEKAAEVGREARRLVCENFSWERVAREFAAACFKTPDEHASAKELSKNIFSNEAVAR